MKKAIIWILLIGALAGGGIYWYKYRSAAPPDAAAKPADEPATARVSHDEKGNAVIHMDDDDQGDAGIVVANPLAGKWSQEVKGYGRVLDPAPLAELVNELVAAEITTNVTAKEYERQKILSAQNNASARAFEAAEAAAQRDQVALQTARDHLTLAWGETLAGRSDLKELAQKLIARQAVLVRVDLAGGEAMTTAPTGARVTTLSGATSEAKLLSAAVTVDTENQGQGFIFYVERNAIALSPGQAVTAWLQVPGEPLDGVIVQRDAVVRTEGAGWVYVMEAGGETFTRRKIPLDRAAEGGWFVSGNLKTDDHIVVAGAQTLLSEELKAALSPD